MLKDDVARRIFQKYLRRGLDGQPVETIEESYERVAMGIAAYDHHPAEFYEEVLDAMVNDEFVPNRPGWFGIGRDFGFTSACTFMNVDDSLQSIMDTLSSAVFIQQAGGGVGWGVSDIRPAGSYVSSTGGKATGPVGFIKAFNGTLKQVQQGGWMMGANNVSLSVDHPDIEEFIRAKTDNVIWDHISPDDFEHLDADLKVKLIEILKLGESSLDQFNTNVLITDDFMAKVAANPDSDEGRLMDKIIDAMWTNGGLGVQFIDTANKANAIPGYGPLQGTNPCSEFWLRNGESCQPGYINAVKCLNENNQIDWAKLAKLARIGTRTMDNLIDANRYIASVPRLKEMAHATRRMGIGPTGLADMLILMGIRYGSPEALGLVGQMMEWILYHSMIESVRLAGERGAFPLIDKSVFASSDFTWEPPEPIAPNLFEFGRPSLDWEWLAEQIKRNGIRNCGHTVIAPSSFGSQTMGTEGYGIEPIFASSYDHQRGDGERDRVGSELASHPSFIAAHQVTPREHVEMAAAAIPFTTESISKTVNMPFGATREDVAEVVRLAHKMKLKNVIVYRSGSRDEEVLVPCVECAEVTG